MTQPRAWGNNAKEARDRTAEELQRIVALLTPLAENPNTTRDDLLRRIYESLISAHTALRFLEGVGAQTRPD
jgi:hypothetical protein